MAADDVHPATTAGTHAALPSFVFRSGVFDEATDKEAKDILIPMGEYFQIQVRRVLSKGV